MIEKLENIKIEALDEIIKEVENSNKGYKNCYFASTDEAARIMKETFGDAIEIIMLPQRIKEDNKSMVYIIPVEDNKPIKVCFENGI